MILRKLVYLHVVKNRIYKGNNVFFPNWVTPIRILFTCRERNLQLTCIDPPAPGRSCSPESQLRDAQWSWQPLPAATNISSRTQSSIELEKNPKPSVLRGETEFSIRRIGRLWRVLRIREVYSGSRIQLFSSRIPVPGSKRSRIRTRILEFKYF